MALYVDHMSQPCRACMLFCRMNNLDELQMVLVNIAKGGTKSAEFRDLNPLGKVPFYKEGDFTLPESGAILRYLADKHSTPDHWYPRDLQKRAIVDSVLDWHGNNLRQGSMIVVGNRVLSKTLGFKANERLVLEYGLPLLKRSLHTMETVFLKNNKRFVASDTEITIADIQLSCEVEQLRMLDLVPDHPSFQELMQEYPVVSQWLNRVATECGSEWTQVNALLHKVLQKSSKL